MSARGLLADIVDQGRPAGHALMIGAKIPQVHAGDGVPVYLVVPHPLGTFVSTRAGSSATLVAYPSHWPGPGKQAPDRFIYARHERLPFDAPIACFDLQEAPNGG